MSANTSYSGTTVLFASTFAVIVGACGMHLYSISKRAKVAEAEPPLKQQLSLLGHPHPFADVPTYRGCVYLDYNATTPVFPEVTADMLPFLSTSFGNPSSSHVFGSLTKQAIQNSRFHVGKLMNASNPNEEIYFTGCGTESDNRAIDIALHHFIQRTNWVIEPFSATRPRMIATRCEHPAIIW